MKILYFIHDLSRIRGECGSLIGLDLNGDRNILLRVLLPSIITNTGGLYGHKSIARVFCMFVANTRKV